MCSRRIYNALAVAGCMVVMNFSASAATRETAGTVLGAIVEVSPDTRTLLLRVGFSEGRSLMRRFELADSTRFRVNGGFGRLADVLVGQTARVTYVRTNDANLAELVDVTDVAPASSTIEAAREASGIESRRRYMEDAASTLDVLEESVGELRQHPDVQGTDQLARLNDVVEELETKLAASRALLSSLSATDSQEAWRLGVDRLSAAIDDFTLLCERGLSEIANR